MRHIYESTWASTVFLLYHMLLCRSFPGKVIAFSKGSKCACGAMTRTVDGDPPPPYKIAFTKAKARDAAEELFVRHYCEKKVRVCT
jgi:hypothetical protein